jgi:hypothetical protein
VLRIARPRGLDCSLVSGVGLYEQSSSHNGEDNGIDEERYEASGVAVVGRPSFVIYPADPLQSHSSGIGLKSTLFFRYYWCFCTTEQLRPQLEL